MTVTAALAALDVSEDSLRLIQSAGIVVSILVGAVSIFLGARNSRAADRTARIKTLMDMTSSHRDIWRQYATRPELRRTLDWDARPDLLTEDQQQFLRELILHLAASFEAHRLGVVPTPEGLDADVRQLMARPLPRAVWRQMRPYQERQFAAFVEEQLHDADRRHQGQPFGIPHVDPRAN